MTVAEIKATRSAAVDEWSSGPRLIWWTQAVKQWERWCLVHWVRNQYRHSQLLIASVTAEHASIYKLLVSQSIWLWSGKIMSMLLCQKLWNDCRFWQNCNTLAFQLKILFTIIRHLSLLEYACPAWHSFLTKEQKKTVEDIQRPVFQVIFSNILYKEACHTHTQCLIAGWQASWTV